MARLKNWGGLIAPRASWKPEYRGRYASQVRFIVRTTSQKTAAEITGHSLNEFRNYCSEAANTSDIAELDKYPPNTLLVRPLDPLGTINGETGWQVAEKLPRA